MISLSRPTVLCVSHTVIYNHANELIYGLRCRNGVGVTCTSGRALRPRAHVNKVNLRATAVVS